MGNNVTKKEKNHATNPHTKPTNYHSCTRSLSKRQKIEGMILGSTAWAKLLGKYDSNERAAEILQDMMKTIEEHPNATMTYRMPPQ